MSIKFFAIMQQTKACFHSVLGKYHTVSTLDAKTICYEDATLFLIFHVDFVFRIRIMAAC